MATADSVFTTNTNSSNNSTIVRQNSQSGSCRRRELSKTDSCDSDCSDGSSELCDCDSCILGFDDANPGEMTDTETTVFKRGRSKSVNINNE